MFKWLLFLTFILSTPAHAGMLFPPENLPAGASSCPTGNVLTWSNNSVVCTPVASLPKVTKIAQNCTSNACIAYCPAGYTATGGGYQAYWAEHVDYNFPYGDNAWYVYDNTYSGGTWTVFVVCLKTT